VIVRRWKGSAFGPSQRPDEAGGSRAREVPGGGGSSPDNDGTSRHCQTGRARQARRTGARVQEPVVEPPQVERRLQPGGFGPVSSAHLDRGGRHGGRGRGDFESVLGLAGSEATVKVCGVVVARLQGKSWAPIPSNDRVVNVGTIPGSPSPPASRAGGGQTHRRSMTSGWGGAAVVVRGRESRSHGQGRQRVRSVEAGRSGGRR
jgi:hypothetical protein